MLHSSPNASSAQQMPTHMRAERRRRPLQPAAQRLRASSASSASSAAAAPTSPVAKDLEVRQRDGRARVCCRDESGSRGRSVSSFESWARQAAAGGRRRLSSTGCQASSQPASPRSRGPSQASSPAGLVRQQQLGRAARLHSLVSSRSSRFQNTTVLAVCRSSSRYAPTACAAGVVWVCGCVGVWVCGCVGVWVCGCVGVWVCGCVGVCGLCGGRGTGSKLTAQPAAAGARQTHLLLHSEPERVHMHQGRPFPRPIRRLAPPL
jgi:hypothetical protein